SERGAPDYRPVHHGLHDGLICQQALALRGPVLAGSELENFLLERRVRLQFRSEPGSIEARPDLAATDIEQAVAGPFAGVAAHAAGRAAFDGAGLILGEGRVLPAAEVATAL